LATAKDWSRSKRKRGTIESDIAKWNIEKK
jgi:hypothetical protein